MFDHDMEEWVSRAPLKRLSALVLLCERRRTIAGVEGSR